MDLFIGVPASLFTLQWFSRSPVFSSGHLFRQFQIIFIHTSWAWAHFVQWEMDVWNVWGEWARHLFPKWLQLVSPLDLYQWITISSALSVRFIFFTPRINQGLLLLNLFFRETNRLSSCLSSHLNRKPRFRSVLRSSLMFCKSFSFLRSLSIIRSPDIRSGTKQNPWHRSRLQGLPGAKTRCR